MIRQTLESLLSKININIGCTLLMVSYINIGKINNFFDNRIQSTYYVR
jgi:hypothetical protein